MPDRQPNETYRECVRRLTQWFMENKDMEVEQAYAIALEECKAK